MNTPGSLSHPKTTQRVMQLLGHLHWPSAEVLDVGAGNGYFSHELGEHLKSTYQLNPGEHIQACDVLPDEFAYAGVQCRQVGQDGRLPFEDNSFDAVISIEVIEHVEDQFYFIRELTRVARPGAMVIATTPNILNMQSRVRSLLCGFAELYDPLPLETNDVRNLGGHIHPIGAYYMAYNALRAGLQNPTFHFGRTKRSASAWTCLLAPFWLPFAAAHTRRLKRKNADIARQNANLLPRINSWGMLTARTAILAARKPS